MENVSKALMMAGGLLISIMVISLIVVLWGRISSYFTEDSNTKVVEQDAEFNAQFENYNKKSIRGNELISVMNKIIDYNRTAADIENYDRIIINIDLKKSNFKYNNRGKEIIRNDMILNQENDMISNQENDNNIKTISNLSIDLARETGIDDTKLQRLSADISNIVDDDSKTGDELKAYKEYRAEKLKSILGYEVQDSKISDIVEATLKYYQYTQFKRAMFKCDGVNYNKQNGRVNEMNFTIDQQKSKI